MKYCVNCGHELNDDDLYCPKCGHIQEEKETVYLADYLDYVDDEEKEEPEDLDEGYRVVLVSRGTCSKKNAKEVLVDLLGYSASTAEDLLDEAPIEIADELNEIQATVLAKALSEYGMDISVVDENDVYVDIEDDDDSVYNSDGSLIETALMALITLSAANRVHRYRRYKKPSLLSLLFRPKRKKPAPVHVRRQVNRHPEPRRRVEIRKQTPKPQVHQNTYSKPANSPSSHSAWNSAQKPASHSSSHNTQQKPSSKPSSANKPASKPSNKPSGSLTSSVHKTSSNIKNSASSKPTGKTSSIGKAVGNAGKNVTNHTSNRHGGSRPGKKK